MSGLKSRLGDASVLLAAAMWGCIGLFTRAMQAAGFTTVQTVAVRAIITFLLTAVIILIVNPKLFKINPRDLWMFFGTGILSFLFFNVCYMSSISENSLSVACILLYTAPIWVASLSIPLFKEKMTSQKTIAFVLAFGGCIMICCSNTLKLTKIGLVFGLCSGLGYALYSIFGKYAAAKYNSLTITFYTFLFGSLGALPLCDVPNLLPLVSNFKGALLSVGVAMVCTVLPYLLYTYGLSKTGASKASVIAVFEPAVASTVGVLFFDESLGVLGFGGLILVMAGLIYLEIGKPFKLHKTH